MLKVSQSDARLLPATTQEINSGSPDYPEVLAVPERTSRTEHVLFPSYCRTIINTGPGITHINYTETVSTSFF